MTSLVVSLIVWVVIMVGVGIGVLLRKTLPEHHLADEAKDVVRLGTALVSTIAALVLSLLIASANSSYETQSGAVKRLTADIILLDNILAEFGPEAQAVRGHMRPAANLLLERVWRERRSESAKQGPFEATAAGEAVFKEILALPAQSEAQRTLKARTVDVSADVARTRLLLFEQAGSALPLPFLAVLVFWLAMIFASFSLFSRLNATLIAALAIFALSASGAIFLIIELSQPFDGLMQISSEPLRHALAPL